MRAYVVRWSSYTFNLGLLCLLNIRLASEHASRLYLPSSTNKLCNVAPSCLCDFVYSKHLFYNFRQSAIENCCYLLIVSVFASLYVRIHVYVCVHICIWTQVCYPYSAWSVWWPNNGKVILLQRCVKIVVDVTRPSVSHARAAM